LSSTWITNYFKIWRKMMVSNESGVKPLGRAVLVKYYEPEKKDSVIYVPPSIEDRSNLVEQRAQVIEVGPACWPDEPQRAKCGDFVLISRMAGYQMRGPQDGQPYRSVNDRDIFAQLTYLGA
jgi:co-chaperonin GroES (HSP10)